MNFLSYRTLLAILLILVDLIAIILVIWRSQGVERTLAWIFAIIAFPGAGAFFFFIITHQPVKRFKRQKRLSRKNVRSQSGVVPDDFAYDQNDSLLTLASTVSGMDATAHNYVEILNDPSMAFSTIERIVRSAVKSIWAEYYIIRKDATGKYFLELLTEMARSGVEVKLLYDAFGSSGLDSKLIRMIRNAGGRVESFNPFNPFRQRWAFHLRNHRKLILVDGKIGLTGGMNVGDEYSGRSRRKGKAYFQDTHVLIEGAAAIHLAQVFREDWAFAANEILPVQKIQAAKNGNSVVSILPSGPDQLYNVSALVFFELLNQAKKNIYLTSPYFIPDEPTYRALEAASIRGVDVRLLLPSKGDVLLASYAARSFYSHLIQIGVRIYEYLPSMLHTKTLLVDGKLCIVGSANFDVRSFRLNFELNALISDSSIARQMEATFLKDIQKSHEIDPEAFSKRNKLEHFKERIARLLSPLL